MTVITSVDLHGLLQPGSAEERVRALGASRVLRPWRHVELRQRFERHLGELPVWQGLFEAEPGGGV